MGLKPENKGHTNFYECCDLTKKVYLKYYTVSTVMVTNVCYSYNNLRLSEFGKTSIVIRIPSSMKFFPFLNGIFSSSVLFDKKYYDTNKDQKE